MTPLESLFLGILAVLLTGHIARCSIENEIARIIAIAATLAAFWVLVAITGEELLRWLIADIWGGNQ